MTKPLSKIIISRNSVLNELSKTKDLAGRIIDDRIELSQLAG